MIACVDDPYYPGGVKCFGTATVQTGYKVCRDGYDDGIGNCVTNCGPGKYGKLVLTSEGVVDLAVCDTCHISCRECIGSADT
jgi:hypothetical protein